jgi:NAD(P)-dependent dehydrogenase (short-subunit alcohol dehydrogenase family)
MEIDGAAALVAGGASGLGRAAAEALRERGADVVILDLPGAREPLEYAAPVAHIVADPMLNGEVIRLDGALRMAPR